MMWDSVPFLPLLLDCWLLSHRGVHIWPRSALRPSLRILFQNCVILHLFCWRREWTTTQLSEERWTRTRTICSMSAGCFSHVIGDFLIAIDLQPAILSRKHSRLIQIQGPAVMWIVGLHRSSWRSCEFINYAVVAKLWKCKQIGNASIVPAQSSYLYDRWSV